MIPATIARVAGRLRDAGAGTRRTKATTDGDAGNDGRRRMVMEVADADSEWGRAQTRAMKGRKMTAGKRLGGLFRGTNLLYTVGWIAFIGLTMFISNSPLEEKRFDPYDILGLRIGASPKEIKSAYRRLSLKYHPDKNPDPQAAVFFAESIAPAYKTLTDDAARENFEKYGHPDGKQSTKLGIALPEQLFGKGGMAPVMLVVLVVGGILLPLFIAMCSIHRMNKFGGNNVLKQTEMNYMYMLKPVLALAKVAETVSVAHEFIEMPFLEGQDAAVSQLLKEMKTEYDSKDNKLMKRKPSIIKAHMLILAQTSRKLSAIPPVLAADAKKVVAMVPRLIEQLLKISTTPINRAGHSYARPQISITEFYQCFTQGVPISSRKRDDDGIASLLQLPHFSPDNVNRVAKKCKSLHALMKLSDEDRKALLTSGGFSEAAVKDIEIQLSMIPRVTTFDVKVAVDGDEDVIEGDFVTATLNVKIARSGGPLGGALPPLPFCAAERKEGWRIFLQDQSTNTLLAQHRLDAREIEQIEVGDGPKEFELQFTGMPSGMYNLGISIMNDYWIGIDAKTSVMMKVSKPTAAVVAAREAKAASRSDLTKAEDPASEESEESEDNSDDEDDYSDEDYPSDETGTSESDDEARARIAATKQTQPPPQPKKTAARPPEDEAKAEEKKDETKADALD